jgi:hypothetical protein
LNLPTTSADSVDAFDKNCNYNTNGDAKHDIIDPLVRAQSSVVHHSIAGVPSTLTIATGAVNKIVSGDAVASDAEKGSTPTCSWSISSKGCLMQCVHSKDVCGVDGCDSVFHHMCQTEWEMYQYHVEFPDGDSKDCIYDSDGKKRFIHHHPHSKLALPPNMSSTKEDASEKLPTTQVSYEGRKSHSMTGDEEQERPSNPSKSSVDSSKIIDEDASSKIDGDEQPEKGSGPTCS